jgi:hypothetical protein
MDRDEYTRDIEASSFGATFDTTLTTIKDDHEHTILHYTTTPQTATFTIHP